MSRLGDRLRRRARGFRARLTVELVRLPELPAPPPPAGARAALPAPERPRRASVGLAALYGRTLDPADDPYGTVGRPRPIGRGPAHDKALLRDQASAWRHGGPRLPAGPDPYLEEIRAEMREPRVPWWEQRD